VTADEVLTALELRHPLPEWAFFPELQLGTGTSWLNGHPHAERRIDAWAISCYADNTSVAYEIKVSRSDFVREMKDARKHAGVFDVASEFYFAAPAGLIKPSELPPGTGLVEVNEKGRTRMKAHAARREVAFGANFVASLARRAARRSKVHTLQADVDKMLRPILNDYSIWSKVQRVCPDLDLHELYRLLEEIKRAR